MKFIGFFILLLGCAALGFFLYPNIIIDPNASSKSDSIESVTVQGLSNGKMKIEIDAKAIKPEEIPEEVSLKSPVKFSSGDTVVELGDGVQVALSAFVYPNVSLTDLTGKLTATTPYKNTTLIQQVALLRVQEFQGDGASPAKPPKAASPAVKAPEPEKEEPKEEEPAVKEPASEEPKEAPGSAAPAATDVGEEELVKIAQEHVKSGVVPEINFDAVSDWKVSEKETLDGQEYQTILATFDKETIFGNKAVVAKALISGGKVQKWVYAQTGVELQ